MCLILLAYDTHPRYHLVLAANRDEFYERPTAPATWWDDAPGVLAGRDLRGGGTWLGVTRGGRIAAVTNVREPLWQREAAPSRGHLVSGFLRGDQSPAEYLDDLRPRAGEYNGFNLLLGAGEGPWWYSNRAARPRRIEPGLHGLSNHRLDTPWPKVERGKQSLSELLDATEVSVPESVFRVLADSEPAADAELPDTGVGVEWERVLSPPFIRGAGYGTRSSTVLFMGREGDVTFVERTFLPGTGRPSEVRHEFRIER